MKGTSKLLAKADKVVVNGRVVKSRLVDEHPGAAKGPAPKSVWLQWPPVLRKLIYTDVEGRMVDGDIWPVVAVLKDGTVVECDQAEDVGNGWVCLSGSHSSNFKLHTDLPSVKAFPIRHFNVQVTEIAWLVEADS